MGKKLPSLATLPILGPDDKIAEGDSRILYDFFPPTMCHPTTSKKPFKDIVFTQLYNEVRWQKMYHVQGEVPRLVCVQGEFGPDGSMPVYRHPSDQSMPLLHFSSTVQLIREQVEKVVHHPVNHVLIQLYRSGQDYISEHSDKTLDIVRGSSIVNVSFGAQRTMRLRTKRSAKSGPAPDENTSARHTQRIAMPHNSIFVLGQDSNMRWLHGITQDKRLPADRSNLEKASNGMRISLTFRQIGTFLDSDTRLIWGQGATAKERSDANDVINNDEEETEKMIHAFGKENQNTEFDWTSIYGAGFDVLHFRAPPVDNPILFASNEVVDNRQVAICLAELGLAHTVMDPPTAEKEYEKGPQICYRDSDSKHTEVVGAFPILLYLDRYHHLDRDEAGKEITASAYEIIQLVLKLQENRQKKSSAVFHEVFSETLEELEVRQVRHGGTFIAGSRFSIADCAAWPVLDSIIETEELWSKESYPALTNYYKTLWKKKKAVGRLRSKLAIK
jgi:alkylated DNA repair dioxygenase AlkB